MADQKAKKIGVCDRCGESVTDTDGFARAETICTHYICQSIESSFALLDFMGLVLRLETEVAKEACLNETYWCDIPCPSTPEKYCILLRKLIELTELLGYTDMKTTLRGLQTAFNGLCTKRN